MCAEMWHTDARAFRSVSNVQLLAVPQGTGGEGSIFTQITCIGSMVATMALGAPEI